MVDKEALKKALAQAIDENDVELWTLDRPAEVDHDATARANAGFAIMRPSDITTITIHLRHPRPGDTNGIPKVQDVVF